MSVASVLARGRVAAEARMVDTCTIRRVVGTQTNTADGTVTPIRETVYTGRCEIQSQEAEAAPDTSGEAYVRLLTLTLKLPVATSDGLAEGDEVTIETGVNDPDLVGRLLRISSLAHKSHATARRLLCIEVTS